MAQSQEQVYAGVILHIMKYVEWPAYEQSMTVGIVNNPSLVKALQRASSGKQVHYKNVDVKTVGDLSNMKNVDVLFFPKKALRSLSTEVVRKAGQHVLVITDQSTHVGKEVSINFVQMDGSLKFELYADALAQQKLKVSSQLKKYAIEK